jgi:hypothetical protein
MGMEKEMKCPKCGYIDPFMQSWYIPEVEVAEPIWFNEWNEQYMLLLEVFRNLIIEHYSGDYVYHLTKNNHSIQRFPIELHKVGFGNQERVNRRNYHLDKE